jgi:hypothetical protein
MPDIPNTTVSVLRGTTTNAFGDEVDLNESAFEHVPALLIETGRNVQDPSTPTPRTIRQIVCHVPPWTGVLDTDRIIDEATGSVYIIISVTRPPTLMGAPVDIRCDLKRVTASTV